MRSPGWVLFLEGEQLIASGGADALYLLDELPPTDARTLHTAWQSNTLASLPPHFAPVLTKLQHLGACYGQKPDLRGGDQRSATDLKTTADLKQTDLKEKKPDLDCRFSIDGCGPYEAIEAAVRRMGGDLCFSGEAHCGVVIRAGGSLMEAAQRVKGLRVPHLFVDVAYHHTISLGPLVWPGETACLSCLAGRIRHAWGDPEPPAQPGAGRRVELCAALILEELRRFRETGTCTALIARTVSIDVESWATRGERVHRLPWCPECFPEQTAYGAGSFALPWEAG